MTSRRLIIAGMIFMHLVMLPFSGDAASAAAGPEGSARNGGATAPQMKIAFKAGLLSLDVRDAEIGEVLRAIAEKAGIGLTVGDGVRGRVSLTLEGLSLEETLRRLCESRAILYEYDPETRTGRIIGAGAFAASSGPNAGLRPDAAVSSLVAAIPAVKTPKEGTAKAVGDIPSQQGTQPPATVVGERFYDSQGRLLYKPRELLVRFRPEAAAEQIVALHQGLGSTLLKSLDSIKLHRVRLREGLTEKEGIALYAASEIVAVAERHALRYPLWPNDPYYEDGRQWGMNKTQMPAAWEKTTGNANVVVGVIDTGVDTGHPDLAVNLVPGRDLAGAVRFNQTDSDADPIDFDGHGTHVAGIIAAVGNNGIGVAGIGWNLRVMPLKVQADDATLGRYMETFDIVAAIDYAIERRVRIVNCSFGGEGDVIQAEYDAFNRLRLAGILAICSAGNSGQDNDGPEPTYPASYDLDNIISVAASNQTDRLWLSYEDGPGSNYGKTSVDLMAPGVNIYSTHLCLVSVECNSYMSRQGTSMAAPHVTGVAGLILSRNPHLGYPRVKSVILESVDLIASMVDKLSSGGRLNAAKALSQTCLPGAVTWSDKVGLSDVIAALRIFSGIDPGVPICQTADVDGDDRIGLAEAIYGLQVLSLLRGE